MIFEGWEYGAPVIASAKSGGAAAVVQSSGGGLVFPDWTEESLAETLKEAAGTNMLEEAPLAVAGRQ